MLDLEKMKLMTKEAVDTGETIEKKNLELKGEFEPLTELMTEIPRDIVEFCLVSWVTKWSELG